MSLHDLPPLYTVADLCQWLRIDSERYVRDRIVKDEWPHVFIDRKHSFTAEQMIAIRDRHVRGATVRASGPMFDGQVTRGSRRPE